MNCTDVRERIHPFIDGELEAEVQQRVLEHMAACEACSRRARFESDFNSALRAQLAAATAPTSVVEGVRQRLRRELPPSWWRQRLSHPAAGYSLAALLLLVMVLALVFPPFAGNGASPGTEATPVSLQGAVVCVECELAGRPDHEQRLCREFTHHAGIRTEDGTVWTLANLGAGAELGSDPDLRGATVRLEGTLYPPIQTVDVARFELVPGPS